MSAAGLDARWPLATQPWRPGTGVYGYTAARRVCIYDVAISAALATTGSTDARDCAAMVLSALASQPADERAAIHDVLAEHGLAHVLAGATVRLALDAERSRLAAGLLAPGRGPRARRVA